MKPLLLLTCALACFATICRGQPDDREFNSPRYEYTFKLVETKTPGLSGLVITKAKQEISNSIYFFQGHFTDAFWNEHLTYVAINNRQADGGDYVWIFSLPAGYAVKQPDNENEISLCDQIGKQFPDFSLGSLRGHYTFAYGWKSPDELLVCSILISDLDHDGVIAVNDTYKLGRYGGYSITERKVKKIGAPDFSSLPVTATEIWSGWSSSWWSSSGTEPAAKIVTSK